MLSPVLHLPDLDYRLQLQAQLALDLVCAEGVAIALEQDGAIVCRARAGAKAPDRGVRLQTNSGITAECVRTSVPVYAADAENDPRVDTQASRFLQVRSILAVPLLENGRAIGVLEALSANPDAFSPEHRERLQSLVPAILELIGVRTDVGTPAQPSALRGNEPRILRLPCQAGSQAEFPEPVRAGINVAVHRPTWKARWAKPAAAGAIVFAINVAVIAVLWLLFSGGAKSLRQPAPLPANSEAGTLQQPSADISGQEAAYKAPGPPTADEIALLNTWAQQGNSRAQLKLAKALVNGIGVPPDPIAGYAWYIISGITDNQLRAAESQLTTDQLATVRLTVSQMFATGSGVKADLASAYYWAQLAAAAGSAEAEKESNRMAAQLSPQQLAQARLRLRHWRLASRATATH